ncbi:MAG: glutathione S-transferase family protein [Pseudomonadales bacterium]|nr:glutathione S-transferase family protein [Pseudomonadales bacterium]MBO7007189.1 glutathione S-transferase family protein [Pseudomonadales bacterium]
MIKLYGLRMSNYYSLVKAILLEKGLEFEEVKEPPSQEEGFLAKSPMGKMPAIEVDGIFISESLAIALWAEQTKPEPALLPGDPVKAAKVMELCCHLKLDVELVARRVLPAAFFGATASDEVISTTEQDLEKGMKAVARIYQGSPFAAGNEFTLADLYTFYTFGLTSGVVQKIYHKDLLADFPQISATMAELAARPSIAQVEADKAA